MELHSQLLSGFSAPTTQWLIHNQVCVCGCISVSALGKSKSADAITNPQQLHLQIFLPAADPVTIQCCERACVRARMPLLIITYKMSFSFHHLRKLKHKNSVVENRPLDVYALRRFWRHKGGKKNPPNAPTPEPFAHSELIAAEILFWQATYRQSYRYFFSFSKKMVLSLYLG